MSRRRPTRDSDRADDLPSDDPRRYFFESHAQSLVCRAVVEGLSRQHRLVTVIGEAGVGKSMFCAEVARRLRPAFTVVVVDAVTVDGVLEQLFQYFGADLPLPTDADERRRDLVLALRRHTAAGHDASGVVVLVDDAEHLTPDALAWLVDLTNLAVGPSRLVRVVLVGAPALEVVLAHTAREAALRGGLRCRLAPLRRTELAPYIRRRLVTAGGGTGRPDPSLTRAAVSELFRTSVGVPAVVNQIASRVMAVEGATGTGRIERAMVREAAATAGVAVPPRWGLAVGAAGAAVVLLAVAFTVVWWRGSDEPAAAASPAPTAAATPAAGPQTPVAVQPTPSEPVAAAPPPAPPVQAPALVAVTPPAPAPAPAPMSDRAPAPAPAPRPAASPVTLGDEGRLVAVGIFRNAKNAEDITAALAAGGLPASMRHDAARGWYSVYVGPYATAEQARSVLPRLRTEFGIRDATVVGERPASAPAASAPAQVPPPTATPTVDPPAAPSDAPAPAAPEPPPTERTPQ